jgi:acetamidase/formamidase
MAVHTLAIDAETAHSFFSPDLPPVLTVDPGDTVVVHTLDAGSGLEAPRLDGTERRTLQPARQGPGGHCLTGPIAVRGARPGMTLELQIESLTPGAFGWTRAGGWTSRINERLGIAAGEERLLVWSLDAATMTGADQLGNLVRLRPFLGVIGMPPPQPGKHSTIPPRPWGGNIDCRELVAGSTLYLPVPVEGALLSLGDGHAAQGDGEVAGPAIECPMETRLRIGLRDDMALTTPQAHTPAGFVTLGFHHDLHEAALIALGAMVDHLAAARRCDRPTALALASVAVSLRITQLVNGVVGAHALLPDDVLLERPTA